MGDSGGLNRGGRALKTSRRGLWLTCLEGVSWSGMRGALLVEWKGSMLEWERFAVGMGEVCCWNRRGFVGGMGEVLLVEWKRFCWWNGRGFVGGAKGSIVEWKGRCSGGRK
jgi:hypothetical protein